MAVYLETSSYLPLLWITPYSRSVVGFMHQRAMAGHTFEIQRDCIIEASGYFSFKDDWRYNPAIRFRRLADALSDVDLKRLPFPSSAVQLLLGGNIWPQAQYLNFVRHTAFFFIDLLDGVSFKSPREGLEESARCIENRISEFRKTFVEHSHANILRLPTASILPYWGKWYLVDVPRSFEIRVVDDPRSYNMTSDKLRDIYHYDCAVHAKHRPVEMIVANTGFQRNVKTSFTTLPIPITCAETITLELFGTKTSE